MKSRKLRNKILTFVLPLTLVPFTLMALAVYYFVIRSYQVQIEDEQSKLLAEAIVNLRKEQDAARRDVALIAGLPAIAEYLEFASRDAITNAEPVTQLQTTARASLKSFFDQNSYYLELSLVDARGSERIKFDRLPGEQGLKSIKENEFFRRTLISGQVQMPVEEVRANRFTTVFTSRVRRATFSGIVVLHLNTAVFQRLMRPLLASHQVSTFLFDDRGFVFERALKGPDEEECLRRIDPAAEAKTMLANFSAQTLTKDVSANNGRYTLSVVPAEEFISFKEPVSGESWFLGSLRLKEPMFGRAGTFQLIFFAGLIGTLVVALWGITRYSRRITEPLEEVAQSTAMIARGQFDISLGVSTGDEVEELAQAVKRMANDLKSYQTELIKSSKLAAIGEMASEISHEIQNRISGLSLWIQYLDGDIAPDDPRREYLQEIKQGLKGFITMLEDLKQSYRTPILNLSDVSLNDLVKESLSIRRISFEVAKHRFGIAS